MKQIRTDDNSITFYNEEFDDIYHSTSGAKTESLEKHVNALGITEFAQNHTTIALLDVCFGLGYNSACAIDEIQKVNPQCSITVLGIEKYDEILNAISDIEYPFACKEVIIEAAKNKHAHKGSITVDIDLRDLVVALKELPNNTFDFCFFDAFSPSKVKDQWSQEVFSNIFQSLKKGGKMSTYSCSKWVRQNMRYAGFTVIDGPCIGRRSPSTIAIKE